MLISKDELTTKKGVELIPLECLQCGKTHYRPKNMILRILKGKTVGPKKGCYCSHECKFAARYKKLVVCCGNCNKELLINPSVLRHSKSGKAFCDKSCAAIYNNTHKTHGIRRSKLEIWLEQKLSETYPNLEIHYNRKDTIVIDWNDLNQAYHMFKLYFQNTNIKFILNQQFYTILKKTLNLIDIKL